MAVCAAALFSSPCTAPAQTGPAAPSLSGTNAPAEPYLDRKVSSNLDKLTRWQARMKKEHFTRYLVAYTAILSTITGLVFGFSAFRLGDPMATYRLVKRRSLQLAVAIGGSLGIFCAVTQVPPKIIGKVSLLLLAAGTGAVITLVATWLVFIVLRFQSNSQARRAGHRVTDRIRHA